MAKIKGVCKNIDECTKAQNRDVQEAERASFVCEECGKELKPIDDRVARSTTGGNKKLVIGVVVLLLLCGGITFYVTSQPEKTKNTEVDSTAIDTEKPDSMAVDTEKPVIEKPDSMVVDTKKPVIEKPTVSKLNLACGTYVGDIKDGKANGQGKMTYKQRTIISKYDKNHRYAEAGQYVIGTWYNGELDFGTLFDNGGTTIGTLTIGRAE